MNGKLEFRKGGLACLLEAAGVELTAEIYKLCGTYDDVIAALVADYNLRQERTAASVGLTGDYNWEYAGALTVEVNHWGMLTLKMPSVDSRRLRANQHEVEFLYRPISKP